MEFDESQSSYGLDRLEIRECELRYMADVEAALSDVRMIHATPSDGLHAVGHKRGIPTWRRRLLWMMHLRSPSQVDAVVFCASAFNSNRQRLPDRIESAAGSIAKACPTKSRAPSSHKLLPALTSSAECVHCIAMATLQSRPCNHRPSLMARNVHRPAALDALCLSAILVGLTGPMMRGGGGENLPYGGGWRWPLADDRRWS